MQIKSVIEVTIDKDRQRQRKNNIV